MHEIKSFSEYEQLKSSSLLIIDFHASWCGPCRFISPIFDRLAAEYESITSVIFAKCDVDQNEDVSKDCQIRAMPTFKFLRNGIVVDTVQGADQGKLQDTVAHYVKEVAQEQHSEK